MMGQEVGKGALKRSRKRDVCMGISELYKGKEGKEKYEQYFTIKELRKYVVNVPHESKQTVMGNFLRTLHKEGVVEIKEDCGKEIRPFEYRFGKFVREILEIDPNASYVDIMRNGKKANNIHTYN